MMVAIEAPSKEKIQEIIKRQRLKITPNTIDWYFKYCDFKHGYLCVSIDEEGKQRGGGHACRKEELGSIKILSAKLGRRQL